MPRRLPSVHAGLLILALALILPALLPCPAEAQLRVNALSVLRNGKLPRSFSEQSRIPSFYSDIRFVFEQEYYTLGLRGEGFNSPELRENSPFPGVQERYLRWTQAYAEARWEWGFARAGNFYELYGKGLLLRGFELPGFIYENQVFRNQQQVLQDFFGQRLVLTPGIFEIRLMNARPVDPLLPPDDGSVQRELGRLTGGQATASLPSGLSVGFAYLEHRKPINPFAPSDKKDVYLTRFLAWSADAALAAIGAADATLDLNAEYLTQQGTGSFGDFDGDVPRGLYGAATFSWRTLGGSVEYKDYNDLDLTFNDPPAAIRESSEVLLRRGTHALEKQSEEGYQIEVYYAPGAALRLTANYSLARNFFDFGITQLFQQRYFNVQYGAGSWNAAWFIDRSQDSQSGQLERWTTGLLFNRSLARGASAGVDLQWQSMEQEFGTYFRNIYVSGAIRNWRNFSAALGVERTEDPEYTETVKYFTNLTLGWQPVPAWGFSLFAGSRRGGTFCESGFCIEVLDFEGLELRVETRL